MMKKRFFALVAMLCVLALLGTAMVSCQTTPPAGTGDGTDSGTTGGGEQGAPSEAQSYVSLDINPGISLTVDAEGRVVSVYGENEDGQVLLYEESGIVGADVEAAIAKIVDLAVEHGYLDAENSVVGTTVSAKDDNAAQELLSKINTKVETSAKALGVTVTTTAEGAFSLLRDLEALKKQYPENEAIQALTVSKYKLALSASETGELSLEAAVELDDAELIECVSEAHQRIEQFATEAFQKAKAEANAIYEKALSLALDGVYHEYYLQNLLKHPTTCYYGGIYQMYRSTATGFEAIADTLVFVEKSRNYPLEDAQVSAIMNALGMQEDEKDQLKNTDGEITLRSVEAYADKLFKNSALAEDLEEKRQALDQALTTAEDAVRVKVEEASAEYAPQIKQVIAGAETVSTALKNMLLTLPESMRTEMTAYLDDYAEIVTDINGILDGGELNEAALREKADALCVKAEEVLEKIKADLSEEELATVETRKAEIEATLTAARAAFENAITEAEAEAKEYLAARKAACKENA